MSLDKNSPGREILGRLGIIGHPWHGLCRNGALTLPNGATKTYPQPSGGAAWVLRVPGTPAVSRTAEQLAADEAAGVQWLDYGILSGDAAQIYSKPLGVGRWIYADSAGDRWLVSAPLHDVALTAVEGATISVRLSRFGVVGGDAEHYDYDVAVPNLGQDGPAVATPNAESPVWLSKSTLRLFRHSVSATGARAAYRIVVPVDAAYLRTQWDWRPTGWVELVISGPGDAASVTINVLRDRAATIGELVVGGEMVPTYLYQEVTTSTDSSAAGSAPACGGTITVTSATTVIVGAGGMAGGNVSHVTRTTAINPYPMYNGEVTRRIDTVVSVTYSALGDPQYTTSRMIITTRREDSHSLAVAAERHDVYESVYDGVSCSQGDIIDSTNRAIVVTADVTVTTTLVIETRVDGVLIDSFAPGPHVAHTVSTHSATGTAQVNLDVDVSRDSTTTFVGQTQSSADARAFGDWEHQLPESASWTSGGEPTWRLEALRNLVPLAALLRGNPGIKFHLATNVITPDVIGYERRRYAGAGFSSWHQVAGQALTTVTAYASRHPVTGVVAVDSVPVCWV